MPTDLVPVDSAARPSQDFREFILDHSAEFGRSTFTTEQQGLWAARSLEKASFRRKFPQVCVHRQLVSRWHSNWKKKAVRVRSKSIEQTETTIEFPLDLERIELSSKSRTGGGRL
jgi:hypothetical protein